MVVIYAEVGNARWCSCSDLQKHDLLYLLAHDSQILNILEEAHWP